MFVPQGADSMPNDLHLSRRTLSKAAFGTFVSAATFRPGRQALAQDATPAGSPETCPSTTPDENEAIVQRYWDEVWNNQNDDALKDIFDAAEVHHWGIGDDTTGLDQFLARITAFRTAFPDFQIHVQKMIREGDMVVTYYTATATHEGEWLGIPATGKKVEYAGVNIFRIACGKVVESWGVANHLGLLQQIGGMSSVATPQAG
jgi:steroid delta-isomerase-like uncharacterized protein